MFGLYSEGAASDEIGLRCGHDEIGLRCGHLRPSSQREARRGRGRRRQGPQRGGRRGGAGPGDPRGRSLGRDWAERARVGGFWWGGALGSPARGAGASFGKCGVHATHGFLLVISALRDKCPPGPVFARFLHLILGVGLCLWEVWQRRTQGSGRW